jgi:cbb3-type cytochrome oxidase maturation protein
MVAIGFLVTFIWTIKSGQYEDDYTPSVRILFDDEVNVIPEDKHTNGNEKKTSSDDDANNKPKT